MTHVLSSSETPPISVTGGGIVNPSESFWGYKYINIMVTTIEELHIFLTSSVTEAVGTSGGCNVSAVEGGVTPLSCELELPTPFALGVVGCANSCMEGDDGDGIDKFLDDVEAKSDPLGDAGVIGGPSRFPGSLSKERTGDDDCTYWTVLLRVVRPRRTVPRRLKPPNPVPDHQLAFVKLQGRNSAYLHLSLILLTEH